MTTKKYSLDEASTRLSTLIKESADTPILILADSQPAAYLIAAERFDAIVDKLEDARDNTIFDEHERNPEPTTSLTEIEREFGLDEEMKENDLLPPITPGEYIQDEFMTPTGMTQYALAEATGLQQTHISQILKGERGITARTALRLEAALGLPARFWLETQTDYDLRLELYKEGKTIADDIPVNEKGAIT